MRDDILDMVDEMIDMDGEVKISGSTFSRSAILREMDPVAYRNMVTDMADEERAGKDAAGMRGEG